MKCWADQYCSKYDTEQCNTNCVGYHQLKFLYQTSNMPQKYQYIHSLRLNKEPQEVKQLLIKWKNNIKRYMEKGKGLLLVSKTKGNGKTTWACIIMNEYFKKIALTNNLKVRGKFINVPEFLNNLKDDFDRSEKQMEKTKKHLKTADLVIWDDIGAEMESKWVRETLYNFINYRISNNLSQIYTSNRTKNELEEHLDDRIYSRIRGQCDGITFFGPDQRWSDD